MFAAPRLGDRSASGFSTIRRTKGTHRTHVHSFILCLEHCGSQANTTPGVQLCGEKDAAFAEIVVTGVGRPKETNLRQNANLFHVSISSKRTGQISRLVHLASKSAARVFTSSSKHINLHLDDMALKAVSLYTRLQHVGSRRNFPRS